MSIQVKRVYEEPRPSDGARVLVDRLWPRGVRKQAAALDNWMKNVAPSAELRAWYGHAPDRFREFSARYRRELQVGPSSEAIEELRRLARRRRHLTLVTATRDAERSGAMVLADVLREGG